MIHGAVEEAKKQAAGAERAESMAASAFEAGELAVKDATKSSAEFGEEEMGTKWSETIKELQDWKMDVLHPLTVEARRLGHQAAKPYEKAMMVTEKRIAEYQQRATGLVAQADGLRAAAVGLANGAVTKQAGGNLAGASKDMMDAHQMMSQASLFHQQATKLMMSAQALQINIPAYQGAAQAAQHAEVFKMAPKLFAPPPVPVSPGMPPPPTDVLLQQDALRRRPRSRLALRRSAPPAPKAA